MKSLNAPLKESEAYQKIIAMLQAPGAGVLADGCVPSQKLHLVDAVSREDSLAAHARFRLIITYSDRRAREIQEEFQFYDRNTSVFPAKDLIFYQADLRSNEIETQRLKSLRRLMEGRPATIVTTFAALMTPQVPLRVLKKNIIGIGVNDEIDNADLAGRLVAMGYQKTPQVDAPGQFAIRGDIVDVFDLTEENPYRIELFDTTVESIRSFDIESQRSIEQLSSIHIYPATELILERDRIADGIARIQEETKRQAAVFRQQNKPEEAHRLEDEIHSLCEDVLQFHDYTKLESYIHYFYPATESFIDLFPQDTTMLFFDEPVHIKEQADAVETEFRESMITRAEKGYVLPGQMELVSAGEKIQASVDQYRHLGMTELINKSPFFTPEQTVAIHARTVAPYNKDFQLLVKDLKKFRHEQYRIILISASRTRAKRLAQDLTEQDVEAFYSENPDRILEPGEVMTYYGHVAHGFEYTDIRLIIIAETDIFGAERKEKRRKKKTDNANAIRSLNDLHVGDYVVHESHGIGVYQGVEKIEIDGVSKDYIKLQYGGGDVLYVLPTELDVLQKYASQEAAAKPRLNKLGSGEWARTKSKVKGAVEEVAEDLVDLYAKRQAEQGHAFPKDTVWQQEFEEMFPYEETDDQLNAIADVKKDMESPKIMDRLICGDVGFGKTEVALRAAFKAVQDSCQVAVLVPTTVLAQQHFNTFTERMKGFPVNIEMMSRLRTAQENKKTAEGLASGRVDIVIGTHRLLSKDVKFRKLGLLIVDEEQRFGVTHKEKIKKLKENVDVLTLSATPIPRTLHMSLAGIRDMSLLEEAPQDRVPIQTYVMEYNEEMVREAIERELSRGGQVYYVYNRVNDILDMTARLQKLVPEARVGYAHGQMSAAELERIMYQFISGDIDVLVSTTIIETGLDIPNVNTIIIHDADRMGLSQLYQLRGRVGRSSRTAYAFLMYKKDKMLKEEAEKRLSAIREFTDLGSGFRIAMRDLEIRGAGAVLGRAQSGHMASVGYDLYCKMLNTAVRQAKGEDVEEEKPVRVNLSVDAFIPENYIVNEGQKLDIYKRIAAVNSLDDVNDVRDELRDRFGDKIPAPAENLLRIALLRSVARKLDLIDITGGEGTIRYTLDKDAKINVAAIPKLLTLYYNRDRQAARQAATAADEARSAARSNIRNAGGPVYGTSSRQRTLRLNETRSSQPAPSLTFFPKGLPKGDYAGMAYFEYRYKMTGITTRDEETLLSAVETFLTDMADVLR